MVMCDGKENGAAVHAISNVIPSPAQHSQLGRGSSPIAVNAHVIGATVSMTIQSSSVPGRGHGPGPPPARATRSIAKMNRRSGRRARWTRPSTRRTATQARAARGGGQRRPHQSTTRALPRHAGARRPRSGRAKAAFPGPCRSTSRAKIPTSTNWNADRERPTTPARALPRPASGQASAQSPPREPSMRHAG